MIALGLGFLAGLTPGVRAEFLYESYLVPAFSTDYSAWDVFYSPYGSPNKPDFAAPFGIRQSASAAGVTPPANSSPANPLAYWDPRNPTITQVGTNSAFIIGPSTTGNIYSFAEPTSFELQDTHTNPVGTVLFQFQTEGTFVDFSSIKLQYTNSSNQVVLLSPNEMLREFQAGTSSMGGLGNRTAVQWNLTGLNITSYKVIWTSASSSDSFQQASLDTSGTYGAIIPSSRNWNASGTGAWSTGNKWLEGTSSNENGNINFINTDTAGVTLDANHTVGELTFNTAANTTINSPNGFAIAANTGIATTAIATGTYTINSNYAFGAYNLFEIAAGEVRINGSMSGNYGMEKSGTGTLVLANNNSFTGDVTVNGGTLKLGGTNSYTGATTVLQGNLVVAADALNDAPGALGNAITNVALGADGTTFANVGSSDATLTIEGDHTVGRAIVLASGSFKKTLAAQGTTHGATFTGGVSIGTSDNIHLHANAAQDQLKLAGGMTGGVSGGKVVIDGQGTVVYSGSNSYSYTGVTTVSYGLLKIDQGTTLASTGSVSVAAGAGLQVNGILAGSGTLTVNGTIGGSGSINRAFTIGTGAVLSPGNSPGTLSTVAETWASGGCYLWQINDAAGAAGSAWDLVNVNGTLSITSGSSSPFKLVLQTYTLADSTGLLSNFDQNEDYVWKIASATSISGFNANNFLVDTSAFANPLNGAFSVTGDATGIYLNYTAVPEPSANAVLCAAAMAVVFVARRRRNARVRNAGDVRQQGCIIK